MREHPTERLPAAPPTRPGDIVDAHCHLFSVRLLEEYVEANPDGAPHFRQALKDKKFGRRGDALPDLDPAEMAAWYAARLDEAGIAKALVVSVIPDSGYTREFIRAANGRVHALCNVDPRDPGAPALLEREMAAGFRGVKLLPVNRCYRLSDPACRPLFEKAEELAAHIIVHYGVTVDPGGDLRYADPTELSPVARDFPGLTFAEVFERSVTALGPQRVLFGTDSNTTAPYRTWIAYAQRRTLEEIGLSEADRDLVLRGNAVRIFRLDE